MASPNVIDVSSSCVQDVNTIPEHVIKQYTLTTLSPSGSLADEPDAHHSSSSNKALEDLPAQLQHTSLDVAANSQSQFHTDPDSHNISKDQHRNAAASTPPNTSSNTEDRPAVINQVSGHSSTQASAERPALPDQQEAAQLPEHDDTTGQPQQKDGAALEHGHPQLPQHDDTADAHGHIADQQADAEPEQLRVPCISIAGWDESPVAVGANTSALVSTLLTEFSKSGF